MHTEELNQVVLVNMPVFIHTRGSAKQLAKAITQIVDAPTKEQKLQLYQHRIRANGLIIMAYTSGAFAAARKIQKEFIQAGVKNVHVLKMNPHLFDTTKVLPPEILLNKLLAAARMSETNPARMVANRLGVALL